MSNVITSFAALEQVEAVRLAAAGGLPTRYAYGELWDRRGMDLQVTPQPRLPFTPHLPA
jgi:hypothetical protein